MKYLYGADAKKIQSYISDSSKLKEIAGASELVEYVCTDLFDDFRGSAGEIIISAAGKIRAVFDSREDVERIMLSFPKLVSEKAEGLQIIQSVVELEKDEVFRDDTDKLEKQLAQELPANSPIRDWSVIDKAPRSGRPVAEYIEGEALDRGAVQKRDAVDKHWKKLRKDFGVNSFPYDHSKLAGTDSFIAVIHADGNSLGKKLMGLPPGNEYGRRWKKFSQELDAATKAAAKRAYKSMGDTRFRPIILGGDDLTVVCAADSALQFTQCYLEAFQEETSSRSELGELTACAGIAFIKDSYPFHFGLELAELLCHEAKNRAKRIDEEHVPSCLMFSLELGSFVESDFEAICSRRLTAGEVGMDFGPYKTGGDAKLPNVSDLAAAAEVLGDCTPLKNGIRRFISELHVSRTSACFLARRLQQIAMEKYPKKLQSLLQSLGNLTGKTDNLEELLIGANSKTPALDLMILSKFVKS